MTHNRTCGPVVLRSHGGVVRSPRLEDSMRTQAQTGWCLLRGHAPSIECLAECTSRALSGLRCAQSLVCGCVRSVCCLLKSQITCRPQSLPRHPASTPAQTYWALYTGALFWVSSRGFPAVCRLTTRGRTSYDDVDVTPTGLHVTTTPTSHVQSRMCVALQAGCADASSKASARTQSMR